MYTGDLQRIAQKCGPLIADLVAEVFAGETLYIPKGGRHVAVRYVQDNPTASLREVMEACKVSKSTAYRALGRKPNDKGR